MKARKSMIQLSTILVFVLMYSIYGRALAQTEKSRLAELTKEAEAVVVGKVTGVRSEWSSDRKRIFSKVSLSVDQYIKGDTPARTVVITQLGGEIDGVGELYSHTARFSKDEEVLVFVKKDRQNNLVVAGGEDGKFKVTKDERTGEKMVHGGLTLKKFTSDVKAILQQQQMK